MKNWNASLMLLIALAIGVGVGCYLSTTPALRAADDKAEPGRYSVIDTEGTNLIVTDNKTSTLYFYTIEKDEKPGADLILRGEVDLHQVGKDVIKPKLYKKKIDK